MNEIPVRPAFAPAWIRHNPGMVELCIAQNEAADDLLGRDPLALLIGMLLDQLAQDDAADELLGRDPLAL